MEKLCLVLVFSWRRVTIGFVTFDFDSWSLIVTRQPLRRVGFAAPTTFQRQRSPDYIPITRCLRSKSLKIA